MTVKSTKSGQPTSASLLTREHAEILYATNYDKWPQTRDPLDDLRKGRTACVRVMSEDECRAEFEAHFKAGGYQYSDSNKANAFGWWLASRRAMGAVR